MNSKVLVPNIVLTNNPRLAEEFNSSKSAHTSFSNYTQSIEDEFVSNEYITLTTENTEIVNFSFEFKGVQGNSSPPMCEIEFIQTGKSFELELLRTQYQRIKTSDGESDFPKCVFFCAFGVSDNLDYWSNFITLVLVGATFSQKFDQPKTIRLSFAIGMGYHEAYDTLLDKLLDLEAIKKLSFNDTQYTGFMGDGNGVIDSDTLTNSQLITSYLLGFNSCDALCKLTINNFLRANFGQRSNVFFVSDNLRALANFNHKLNVSNSNDTPRTDEKKVEIYKKIRSDTRQGETFFEGFPIGLSPGSIAATVGSDRYLYGIIARDVAKTLKETLGLDTNFSFTTTQSDILGTEMYTGLVPELNTRLTPDLEGIEPDKIDSIKDKIQGVINKLKEGSNDLFESRKVTLVREFDTQVIKSFFNNLSEEDRKKLPLNEKMPIIMFGDERLIRAMLYGEKFSEDNRFTITLNRLPQNEEAEKLFKVTWKSLDLYGSQPQQEDLKTIENVLLKSWESKSSLLGLENFPIFRYNTPNPNVLSLSVEENNAFFSMIYAGYKQIPKMYNEYKILRTNIDEEIQRQIDVTTDLAAQATLIANLIERERQRKQEKALALNTELRDKIFQAITVKYINNDELLPQDPYDTTVVPEIRAKAKKVLELLTKDSSIITDLSKYIQKNGFRTTSLATVVEPVDDKKIRSNNFFNSQLQLASTTSDPEFPTTMSSPSGRAKAQRMLRIADKLNKEALNDSLKKSFDERFAKRIDDYTQYLLIRQAMMEVILEGEANKIGLLAGYSSDPEGDRIAVYTTHTRDGDTHSLVAPPRLRQGESPPGWADSYTSVRTLGGIKDAILRSNVTLGSLVTFKKNPNPDNFIDPAIKLADLYRVMKEIPITVELETLPFFNLSNLYWVGHPCLLYAYRPTLIGNKYVDELDDFLSGAYMLVGFKHKITSSACSSSIILVRIEKDITEFKL